MKNLIFYLLFLFSHSVQGQTSNKYAVLDVYNSIIGYSISASKGMTIVSSDGKIYHSTGFDSKWTILDSIYTDTSGIGVPILEKASFFNSDTAIVTGYIDSEGGGESPHCGLYLTFDSGRTWKVVNYGGVDRIYDAFVDKHGHAWIGGTSGEIYYSKDFGQHWEKLNSPFVDPDLWVNSIYMLNSQIGYAGALFNAIYLTTNNWKTSRKIETPFTQLKYDSIHGDANRSIDKLRIWKNFLVVNQYGYCYWADTKQHYWKEFPIKITDFEVDPRSSTLLALTADSKLVAFTTPTDYRFLSSKEIYGELKVTNNKIYAFSDYEFFKLDSRGLTHRLLLSNRKITNVFHKATFNKFTWGVNDISLYLSKDGGKEWYRENVIYKDIIDIKLLSDSVAILRDRDNRNFMYSLKTHTLTNYNYLRPIDGFLNRKISSLRISSGIDDGDPHTRTFVYFISGEDGNLSTGHFTKRNYNIDTSYIYEKRIDTSSVLNILQSINLNPYSTPSISDFRISINDKKNYFSLVDEYLQTNPIDFFARNKKIDKSFYYRVPDRLSSINNQILTRIFEKGESIWTNTSHFLKIELINESNDTLHISSRYFKKAHAWNLPWQIEYKGIIFNCNSLLLSKLIEALIPDGFTEYNFFDNKYLIMEIADYLYNK